jgi:hypothetical protein
LLSQVATSVTKVATSIDGQPVTDPRSVVLRPGQNVVYTISGALQDTNGVDVVDVYDNALEYFADTGACFLQSQTGITVTVTTRPTNAGEPLLCSPLLFGSHLTFNFTITYRVRANATPHTDPNFNVACVENSPTVNLYNLCSSVAGTNPSPPPSVTPTATPTRTIPPLPPLLLPPPPPPLLPPPPIAPLLPPPPIAPLGGPVLQPPMASVPVIPEADSLLLVVAGLALLGLGAGWRAWRRRGGA